VRTLSLEFDGARTAKIGRAAVRARVMPLSAAAAVSSRFYIVEVDSL